MKKLIGMTEFVIKTHDEIFDSIDSESMMFNYALFLKQTPTLGMFVPCDEEGNVLEKPENYNDWLKFKNKYEYGEFYTKKCKQYKQAEQRVIFQGWELAKKRRRKY